MTSSISNEARLDLTKGWDVENVPNYDYGRFEKCEPKRCSNPTLHKR